jgi:hypothetical protein
LVFKGFKDIAYQNKDIKIKQLEEYIVPIIGGAQTK